MVNPRAVQLTTELPFPLQITIHNEDVRINSLHDEETSWFNSRVKCFPLYTIMLACERTEYDLLSLGVQGHELDVSPNLYTIIHLTHFLSLCLVDLADAAVRQDQNRHHLDTFAGGSGGCARLCAEHNKVPSWQILQIAAQNRSKLFLSASQCRSQSYAQKGHSAAQDATTITRGTSATSAATL